MIATDAYARAGVDVDIEAQASRIMYEASKKTFVNRAGKIGEIVAPFDDFAGLKMVSIENLPAGSFMSMGFDTAGTKVEIAERIGVHNTIAYDLFAMVCDDAIVRGGEPILIGSNLDLKSLGTDERHVPIVQQLADGYVAAAHDAGVAIINGEIAQMGSLMGGEGDFPYHWGATCMWVARKEKLFTGLEIKTGDAVVVLREKGFRTNGISLMRSVFERVCGKDWHMAEHEGSTLGLLALTPSIIYTRFVIGLHGGFDTTGTCELHGVAHITGGGVPEKLGRVLRRSKLGARLPNLFDPPEVMSYCQRVGEISDRDAYRAWNMGQGLAIITPEPDRVTAEAKAYGIEAHIAGEIIPDSQIIITSKGIESPQKELMFEIR